MNRKERRSLRHRKIKWSDHDVHVLDGEQTLGGFRALLATFVQSYDLINQNPLYTLEEKQVLCDVINKGITLSNETATQLKEIKVKVQLYKGKNNGILLESDVGTYLGIGDEVESLIYEFGGKMVDTQHEVTMAFAELAAKCEEEHINAQQTKISTDSVETSSDNQHNTTIVEDTI